MPSIWSGDSAPSIASRNSNPPARKFHSIAFALVPNVAVKQHSPRTPGRLQSSQRASPLSINLVRMTKSRPRKEPAKSDATKPDTGKSRAGKDEPCLFCKVVSRELEAKIIFEDEISLAFLDVRPLFPGHVLLIPKAHYPTLTDLPAALIGPFFSNAQMLSRKVQQVMKAEGTFVAMNNVVSQSVPHLHVHIVPRKRSDGLRGFFWPRRPYQEGEMLAMHEALSGPPPKF